MELSMLAALRFVNSGVGKSKIDFAMKHVKINNGRVTGTNGIIALSAPLTIGFNCAPEAAQLVKAIDKCKENVAITQLDPDTLRVSSGRFRVAVQCYPQPLPDILPEGVDVQVDPVAFLEALDKTHAFICSDPNQPWSNGVLIRGHSMYATNNIALIEIWLGTEFPHEVNIPSAAVDRLLGVGEPFSRLQISQRSISFHYPDGRWIKSQLLTTKWPDISKPFGLAYTPAPVPEGMMEAISRVSAFTTRTGFLHFREGEIGTDRETDKGASCEVEGLSAGGCYRMDVVKAVMQVAESIDLSGPVAQFRGKMLRGVFTGTKQ